MDLAASCSVGGAMRRRRHGQTKRIRHAGRVARDVCRIWFRLVDHRAGGPPWTVGIQGSAHRTKVVWRLRSGGVSPKTELASRHGGGDDKSPARFFETARKGKSKVQRHARGTAQRRAGGAPAVVIRRACGRPMCADGRAMGRISGHAVRNSFPWERVAGGGSAAGGVHTQDGGGGAGRRPQSPALALGIIRRGERHG